MRETDLLFVLLQQVHIVLIVVSMTTMNDYGNILNKRYGDIHDNRYGDIHGNRYDDRNSDNNH